MKHFSYVLLFFLVLAFVIPMSSGEAATLYGKSGLACYSVVVISDDGFGCGGQNVKVTLLGGGKPFSVFVIGSSTHYERDDIIHINGQIGDAPLGCREKEYNISSNAC